MYKLIVLTDPDTADGFRLAGVDVTTAETPDDARKALASLIDEDDSGIIAVNERLMSAIDEPPAEEDRFDLPSDRRLPADQGAAGGRRGPSRLSLSSHSQGDRVRHHVEAGVSA